MIQSPLVMWYVHAAARSGRLDPRETAAESKLFFPAAAGALPEGDLMGKGGVVFPWQPMIA